MSFTKETHPIYMDAMKRALDLLDLKADMTAGENVLSWDIQADDPSVAWDLGFQFAVQMGLLQENSRYDKRIEEYPSLVDNSDNVARDRNTPVLDQGDVQTIQS